ncbi:MAG: OadG family protein [Ruminococcus sp.]|nr:OadG family protein [Ruminococcus sp.]
MNQLLLNTAQLLLKGTDRNLDSGTISSVVITGVVVVFIGLILLILFVYLYGKIFESINNKKSEKAKKALENKMTSVSSQNISTSESVPKIEDGIDEEIVAVISAAVMAMSAKSGKKLALKSVKYAKPSRPVWANAGIAENTRPF